MTSYGQNFNSVSGDTIPLTITVRKADGKLADLTGSTIKFVATKQGETTVAISKDTSAGITILDQTTNKGQCRVTLAPADTESLSGVFAYEVEVTDAIGNVNTVTRGTFHLAEDLVL